MFADRPVSMDPRRSLALTRSNGARRSCGSFDRAHSASAAAFSNAAAAPGRIADVASRLVGEHVAEIAVADEQLAPELGVIRILRDELLADADARLKEIDRLMRDVGWMCSVWPRALYADATLSRYSRLAGASIDEALGELERAPCRLFRGLRALGPFTAVARDRSCTRRSTVDSSSVSVGARAEQGLADLGWRATAPRRGPAVVPCASRTVARYVQHRHERAPRVRGRRGRPAGRAIPARARSWRPRPRCRRDWSAAGRPAPCRSSDRPPRARAPAPDRCRHPDAGSRDRSSAVCTIDLRASVAPGRLSIRSWTSKTNEFASERTCWNRRSARRASNSAAPRPAARLTTTSAAASDADAMPPQELAERGTIAVLGRARTGRPSRYRSEIVAERRRRAVAALRLLADRRQHDRVEIAAQALRPRPAVRRRGARARRGRLGLADRSLERHRRRRVGDLRALAGEQLVENQAERIDVGARRDRPPRTCSGLV